jgi:DNA-binding CsgD family transcriptional regulator
VARLSAADRAAVTDIRHSLATYVDGGPSGLAQVIAPVRELLRFDLAVAYGVDEAGHGFRLGFAEADGSPGGPFVRRVLDDFVGKQTQRFAAYDPRRPEPWNRNAVVDSSDLVQHGRPTAAITQVLGRLGVQVSTQLRVLLCDGPSLLAWVGGFRSAPYSPRDRRVLGTLVPDLCRRLRLERALLTAPTARAALDVAMESLASAAFLVSSRGTPLAVNTAARRAFDADPQGVRSQLVHAVRCPRTSEAFRIVPVSARGSPPSYLVIGRAAPDTHARVQRAAQAWGLTRRQHDVLALVADGHSNARVAADLNISDRTVEVHLTAIMARAQVASRAALVGAALR